MPEKNICKEEYIVKTVRDIKGRERTGDLRINYSGNNRGVYYVDIIYTGRNAQSVENTGTEPYTAICGLMV